MLVYDAKTRKVVSINAEGTAPKLATIDWYKKNNGGKLPVNDSLLVRDRARRDRRLVHAARPLGHDDVRRGAAAGHRDGRAGIRAAGRAGPVDRDHAQAAEVPEHDEALLARRQGAAGGRRLPEPGRGADAPEAGGGREGRGGQGPPRGAAGRARSLLQGRHRQGDGGVLRAERRAVPLRGFRRLHGEGRDAGLDQLPRLRDLQERVRHPGPGRAVRAQHPRGLRPARRWGSTARTTSTRAPRR